MCVCMWGGLDQLFAWVVALVKGIIYMLELLTSVDLDDITLVFGDCLYYVAILDLMFTF